MSVVHYDVALITDDDALRSDVERHRPAACTLCCVSSRADPLSEAVSPDHVWLDLDAASEMEFFPDAHRVYFYSTHAQAAKQLPSGIFIRKPGTASVFEVLWAGAQRPRRPRQQKAPSPNATDQLPAWLTEYQIADLKVLGNKLVTEFTARFGFDAASLYLHDAPNRLLTLSQTTRERSIDLTVPVDSDVACPMLVAARERRILRTTDITSLIATHRISRAAERAAMYADRHSIVLPLLDDEQLIGILNLSGGSQAEFDASIDLDQRLVRFLGRAVAIARALAQARTEARIDFLTGLYNQRWMNEALASEVQRAERFHTPLTLLVIDLDGMKTINDCEGHAAGDFLLRHVAQRITGVLRQFDGAARIGGDEFVVMLPGTDLCGAEQVANRLLKRMRESSPTYRDAPLRVTGSIGVAEWQPGWDAARLCDAADQAMYRAKRSGAGVVCERRATPRSADIASVAGLPPDLSIPRPAVTPPPANARSVRDEPPSKSVS